MSPTTTNLAHRAASVNGASVSAQTAAPRVRRGRRPASELSAIRVRVEALMLQGLRSPAIRRALTGPECPNPIAMSERGVRDHMRAVERSWGERASAATLEADWAKRVAMIDEVRAGSRSRARRCMRARTSVSGT
jgi:hypothetical protein